MNHNLLPDYLARTASLYFEGLGTPFALKADILFRSGDWKGLAELSVDPRRYADSASYCRDNAAASLLKKLSELPTGIDRRAAALRKWWDGERDCYRSNERLNPYLRVNRNSSDRVRGVEEVISSARKIILRLIGPKPNDLAIGRHGPGSTYSDRGGKTTVPDKMFSNPSLTRDAIWYLPQWLGTQWGTAFVQRRGEFIYSRGNRFATVPKTCLTDRSIAAEPTINVFYQLALGRQIRERLRSRGWDLDRAETIHRQVACESSVSLEFSTLDLSNASDTVCSNLVELLLPPAWFDQLNDLRSKFTWLDGRWVRLEKFSSMGNGFTFELESLLFIALCSAAILADGGEAQLGREVFVFGDDIIVPRKHTDVVRSVLRFFGFKLNEEKSFFGEEPFRESCGGDFFAGKPVRGYYLKQLPTGPQGFIAFANGLTEMADRLSESDFRLPRSAWFSVLDRIPSVVRSCRGPKDLGDLVITDSIEHWTTRLRSSIRYVKVFRPWRLRVIAFSLFDGPTVLACATYGVGQHHGSRNSRWRGTDGVNPRDAVLSYKVGWVPYS